MLFLVLLLLYAVKTSTMVACPAGYSCNPLNGTSTVCPASTYSYDNLYYCLTPPPGNPWLITVYRLQGHLRLHGVNEVLLLGPILKPLERRRLPKLSGRVRVRHWRKHSAVQSWVLLGRRVQFLPPVPRRLHLS